MEEYRVLNWADGYVAYLATARRLNEEEKQPYSQWFRDTGFIKIGDSIALPQIHWDDCPKRQSDGSFLGCTNWVWILTQQEWDAFVSLNEEREKAIADAKAKEEAELAAKQAAYEAKKSERVSRLDAWKTEDLPIWDEGGKTHRYRHTLTMDGKTYTFDERNLFDVGRVINPSYAVTPDRQPGGLPTFVDGAWGWQDFGDGGWHFIRPMEAEEQFCFRIVLDYGKYARHGVRM